MTSWKVNIEKQNLQSTSFFPGFELKFKVFQFLSKFQAFSRSGKVNEKIPGLQGFPGSLGTVS